ACGRRVTASAPIQRHRGAHGLMMHPAPARYHKGAHMYQGRHKRRIAAVAAVAAGALLAVACSSSSAPPSSTGAKVKGGTVTFAEEPGTQPHRIWPFTPITNYSV